MMQDQADLSLRRRGDAHETTGGRQRLAYYPEEWADQPLSVILRAYREAYGQSQQEVADNLRIRRIYIEALEDGNYGELPGEAYASGFVRSYAQYLGLPAPDMSQRFRDEIGHLKPHFKAVTDHEVPNSTSLREPNAIPPLLWVGFGALVILVLYFALLIYAYLTNGNRWLWVPRFDSPSASITTLRGLNPEPLAGNRPSYNGEDDSASLSQVELAVDGRLVRLEDGTAFVTVGERDINAEALRSVPALALEIQVPAPAYRLPAQASETPKVDSLVLGDTEISLITLVATGDLVYVMIFNDDNSFLDTQQMVQGDRYTLPDIAGLKLQLTEPTQLEIHINDTRYRLPASLASRAVLLTEETLVAEAILLD